MAHDPCGCETVCNLPSDELEARVATVRAELLPLVRRRRQLPDGIAWEFERGAGMRTRLEQFVEFERQCCSGLAFEIEEPPQADILRLTVRGAGASAFEALGGSALDIPSGPARGGAFARVAKAAGVGVLASARPCG